MSGACGIIFGLLSFEEGGERICKMRGSSTESRENSYMGRAIWQKLRLWVELEPVLGIQQGVTWEDTHVSWILFLLCLPKVLVLSQWSNQQETRVGGSDGDMPQKSASWRTSRISMERLWWVGRLINEHSQNTGLLQFKYIDAIYKGKMDKSSKMIKCIAS